jgi:hypothetical protein
MLSAASNTPARVVRIGGYLTAGALAGCTLATGSGEEVPFVIALFGAFAFAFTSVTGRAAPVSSRAIAAGGIAGVSAALGPAIVFMLWPPIPASGRWALVVVVAAAAVAAWLTGFRSLGGFSPRDSVFAGLLAAVVAGLLIAPVLLVMGQFGPARWVPPTVSHALTPAARLAERRDLAGEHYLSVLLLGALLAVLLGALALRARGRIRTSPPVRRSAGPRQIDLGEIDR